MELRRGRLSSSKWEGIQRSFECEKRGTEWVLDSVPSQRRNSSWTRGQNIAKGGGDGPTCQWGINGEQKRRAAEGWIQAIWA